MDDDLVNPMVLGNAQETRASSVSILGVLDLIGECPFFVGKMETRRLVACYSLRSCQLIDWPEQIPRSRRIGINNSCSVTADKIAIFQVKHLVTLGIILGLQDLEQLLEGCCLSSTLYTVY